MELLEIFFPLLRRHIGRVIVALQIFEVFTHG